MKNKVETEPKNIFVQYLTTKQKTLQSEITFSQLINDKILNQNDQKSIKYLFELILSNEIELAKFSRFPYVFTIRLANSKLKSKDLSISNCIELFELYTKEISNTIDWLDFEKITDSVFSEYGICKEIEKLKLPTPEIKILFKTINGFLMGQHPVFLNDMQFRAEELIHFSLLLSDENNKLIEPFITILRFPGFKRDAKIVNELGKEKL